MPRISYRQLQGDLSDEQIVVPVKKPRRKQRPEDLVQKACVKYLRLLGRITQHKVRFIVAQPDSMGRLTPGQINHRIEMGLLHNSGHPEMIVIDTRAGVRFIMVEFKAGKGRMSDEQRDWANWCAENGIEHCVPRSVEDLAALIRW